MYKVLFICLYFTFAKCITDSDNPGIKLEMYKPNESDMIYINSENLNEIDPSLKLVFIIHGWTSSPDDPKFQELRDAILELKTHNVIMVNWKRLASSALFIPVLNETLTETGKYIGNLISSLHTNFEYNLKSVHVIGHSIGAQIAGRIGFSVMQKTSKKIGRITGLDPAGPYYLHLLGTPVNDRHISKDDAEVVDIIHTDAGGKGIGFKCGTLDFVVNCGTNFQPHCKDESTKEVLEDIVADKCSHWASLDYLITSVKNPEAYPAIKCYFHRRWWSLYILGYDTCFEDDVAYLAFDMPLINVNKTGTFYIDTKEIPPYSGVINVKKFEKCVFY